ncbi:uncharacterized protein MYCFIDRAFT_84786 [Pseudocercospora fijiensis CIRAD86]|uniref:Uncharacterized protein n=1 Tax=Pseudocercospora fijiensis (strain CIRAD86) TaxID=383855 RepID=M2ZZT6_PSEFD|nr:uncharacterized protein MYCFIDRAFT_84786 [Pseudocercospora fijiensis CIRAD86]EME77671.1 hypothetical protein MYCFIDRAFT_84786 [Pseudocercospora fijiensis CIRAD86]
MSLRYRYSGISLYLLSSVYIASLYDIPYAYLSPFRRYRRTTRGLDKTETATRAVLDYESAPLRAFYRYFYLFLRLNNYRRERAFYRYFYLFLRLNYYYRRRRRRRRAVTAAGDNFIEKLVVG